MSRHRVLYGLTSAVVLLGVLAVPASAATAGGVRRAGHAHHHVVRRHDPSLGTIGMSGGVFVSGTTQPWVNPEPPDTSAYGSVTFTNYIDDSDPSGTLTFTFFENGTCAGSPVQSDAVPLTDLGQDTDVDSDNSNDTGPLPTGVYSGQAILTGSNYSDETSPCVMFQVGSPPTATTLSTTVYDYNTDGQWDNTELAGAQAHDEAVVAGTNGATAGGTVTFELYATGDCSGAAMAPDTEGVSNGVAWSGETAGLAAGNYSYQAIYSGDGANLGSTSGCEPFSVGLIPTTTSTQVNDAVTNNPWSGSESAGATAYDTASVTFTPSETTPTPTGSVTYTLYTNGNCSGTPASTDVKALDAVGHVPKSATSSALVGGTYSYLAAYSGDGYFQASTGPCESFSVKAPPPPPPTLLITTSSLPSATVGTAYSAQLAAAGGVGSYTWGETGALPGGLALSSGGLFSGTPTAKAKAGSYPVTVTVTDADHTEATRAFSIQLNAAPATATATVASAPASASITLSSTNADTVTVTGDAKGGTPTGSVAFYVCGPSASAQACTSKADPIGSATLSPAGGAVASASSPSFGPGATGTWCFAAYYSGDSTYQAGADASTGECFTVTQPTVVTCQAGQNCGATVPTGTGTLQVTGTPPGNGNITVDLQTETVNCGSSYTVTGQFVDLNDTGFTGGKALTVVFTIQHATDPSDYLVCYQDPTPFTILGGGTATTGFLASCKTTLNVAPCVQSDKTTGGNVVITLLVPPGDPKAHPTKKKHPKAHLP